MVQHVTVLAVAWAVAQAVVEVGLVLGIVSLPFLVMVLCAWQRQRVYGKDCAEWVIANAIIVWVYVVPLVTLIWCVTAERLGWW